jgi:hypothetical protein
VTRSLNEIADRLYGLPPATFVSARDDEVAQARSAGDKGEAKAIAGLRRPTVAAWMVNLLALRKPDSLAELIGIGAAMRAAQSNLKGSELRELTSKRRAAISRLVNTAAELAVQAGAARSGLPVSEVETTLTAAVANEDIARDVQSARLVKTAHYDGFGEMPRPDLQLVPGGRAESPADRAELRRERALNRPAKAGGERTGPPRLGADRTASTKKQSSKDEAPSEEAPKVSSAALARRRSAARRLHQAEVGLTAARKAYQVAESALRSAEANESEARAAFETAERDLQE